MSFHHADCSQCRCNRRSEEVINYSEFWNNKLPPRVAVFFFEIQFFEIYCDTNWSISNQIAPNISIYENYPIPFCSCVFGTNDHGTAR